MENKTFEQISEIKLGDDSYTTLLLHFPTNLNNKSINQNKLYNLKKKLKNNIIPPQLPQQDEFSPQQLQLSQQQDQQQEILRQIQQQMQQQIQQQNQQQMQQQTQQQIQQQNKQQIQEETPQMQLQLKINEFKERLQRIKSNKSNNLEEKKAKLESNILIELEKIKNNPKNENIQKQIKISQRENLQKLQKELIKRNNTNLKNPVNVQNYICKYPGLEVEFKSIDEIFFGYNLSLFVKSQNGEYKLYYKYSYHDSKFYELKKQGEDLREEEINIESIPTYDILCLYEIIINKENNEILIAKLIDRIDKAKQNISNTEQKFFVLTNSNFNKEKKNSQNKNNKKNITNSRYKNFGKVKKIQITGKIYIFFGAKLTESTNNRSIYKDFFYVCFEDKDKVFYYVKNKKNEKKQLFDFPYIYPLEDLISFILLRRIITNDTNFANKIYEEAKKRIKFLKTKEFQDKIRKNKNLNNFKVTPQELNLSKNSSSVNFNIYKQISILPISPYGITDT